MRLLGRCKDGQEPCHQGLGKQRWHPVSWTGKTLTSGAELALQKSVSRLVIFNPFYMTCCPSHLSKSQRWAYDSPDRALHVSPFPQDNKGQNGIDLKEADDIKKRRQEHTEELYKKYLHDPDNHDGVIPDLEPDILECEVKWALGSITMNKASGGDGIPVELFQILKEDAVKVLHSYASKFGKLSSGHRTGKGQLSFQSQRKAMPKNAQTTAQLYSSHTLVK